MLLERGTGSGQRGTGNGSLGTSCQRKPPQKSKMAVQKTRERKKKTKKGIRALDEIRWGRNCNQTPILRLRFEQVVCFFQGGAHDLAKFRVPMIHRFMTSHPVAELLLCFREAPRWMPDAIWFSRYFNPQANGIMYLECREC